LNSVLMLRHMAPAPPVLCGKYSRCGFVLNSLKETLVTPSPRASGLL